MSLIGNIKSAFDPAVIIKQFITPEKITGMMQSLDDYLKSFELLDGELFPELSLNKIGSQYFFFVKTLTITDGKVAKIRTLAKMPADQFFMDILTGLKKPEKQLENNHYNKPAL